MLLISRRHCENKREIFHLGSTQFKWYNFKITMLNRMSTDLRGTWFEVVAQPRWTTGGSFRVVWWNTDGGVAWQQVSARRCFPLWGVWSQRRSITLHKSYTACVRKSSLKKWMISFYISMNYFYVISVCYPLILVSKILTLEMVHLPQKSGQTAWQSALSSSCRPGCKSW